MSTMPASFLLIQLYHLGDVLLATPAIRALRRRFPDARIDFLAGARGCEVLEGNPHLDATVRWERGVRAFPGIARRLRKARYEVVVDFLSKPSTAQLAFASGAAVRVGIRGRGPRNLLYTDLLPKRGDPTYMARQKVEMLGLLGVPATDDLDLELVVGDEHRRAAEEILERLGVERGRPLVALSAVAAAPYKQWGAAKWARVADALCDAGAQVLLTRGPGEEEQVRAVAAAMRHAPFMDYGDTGVRELGALYERCVLWVGNDGGPKHVAVAVGTPTVTVCRDRIGATWTDLRPGSGHEAVETPAPGGCDHRCARCGHLGCLAALGEGRVSAVALARLAALAG